MLKVGIIAKQDMTATSQTKFSNNKWEAIILKTVVKDCGFTVGDMCVLTSDSKLLEVLVELADSFSKKRIEAILVTDRVGSIIEPYLNRDKTITIGRQRILVIIIPNSYPNRYKGKYHYDLSQCKKRFG